MAGSSFKWEYPKPISGLEVEAVTSPHKKIWVDLDNSPHVPFFRPIIDELTKRDYELFVTARDAYQVRELLEFYGVSARIVGKHYGKHKIWKACGTCWRALALAAVVRKEKPDLAISHGSRGCVLTSSLLGIPSVVLMDYEFTSKLPGVRPTWLMVPSVVPDDSIRWQIDSRVLRYPGIKEDVYLASFRPDEELKKRLGISGDELVITVRPPATEAHYHNPESEILLTEVLHGAVSNPIARVILLPRNKRQENELRSSWTKDIVSGKILIPQHAEDGLNLIWNSDLVVSGGGTMNREAAGMGVPVYSIFRGRIGAVDRYLADRGRLILLETVEDVRTKIKAVHREHEQHLGGATSLTLAAIVRNIISIVESKTAVSQVGPPRAA